MPAPAKPWPSLTDAAARPVNKRVKYDIPAMRARRGRAGTRRDTLRVAYINVVAAK